MQLVILLSNFSRESAGRSYSSDLVVVVIDDRFHKTERVSRRFSTIVKPVAKRARDSLSLSLSLS